MNCKIIFRKKRGKKCKYLIIFCSNILNNNYIILLIFIIRVYYTFSMLKNNT